MKRLLAAGACALALSAGAAAAQAATPIPQTSSTAQPTPTPTSTRTLDPQTAEDCGKTHTTVTDGIGAFMTELEKVDAAAASGDPAGVDKSVQSAGAELVNLSTDLKADVEDVENPELATAVTDVANELNSLGASLTSLTSLQNLDATRLQALSDRVSQICGG